MSDRPTSSSPVSLGGRVLSSDFQPGVTYRLERQVGEGGMGSAYLALRQAPEGLSPVVVKLVRPSFGPNSDRAASLVVQKEAVALGRLNELDGTRLPHPDCPMAVSLKEGREVRGAVALAERPDGTRVPFMPFPKLLRGPSGEIVEGINMLVDLSERFRAEEEQRTWIDELNHRVKNTLATVQSLAAGVIGWSDIWMRWGRRRRARARMRTAWSRGSWRAGALPCNSPRSDGSCSTRRRRTAATVGSQTYRAEAI